MTLLGTKRHAGAPVPPEHLPRAHLPGCHEPHQLWQTFSRRASLRVTSLRGVPMLLTGAGEGHGEAAQASGGPAGDLPAPACRASVPST